MSSTYCAFDSYRQDVLCLAIYFKWKYFVLIDNIIRNHFMICLFCFCVLFSNIYPKIKFFIAKIWSDLCNFYRKEIFLEFFTEKIFFFTFLCWIWIIDVSQQYYENLWNIEQMELVENLPPSYLPYRFLHNLHSFLIWKKWQYLIF